MNEDVVEYIRANRGTYTREALDDKLREAGYFDYDIEAAWQAIHDDDSPAQRIARAGAREEQASRLPQATPSSSNRGDSTTLIVVVIFLVIAGFILLVLTNLGLSFRGGFNSSTPPDVSSQLAFVNCGSLVVLIALISMAVWLKRSVGWSGGRVAGLLFAVALVWYVVLAGTCLYG